MGVTSWWRRLTGKNRDRAGDQGRDRRTGEAKGQPQGRRRGGGRVQAAGGTDSTASGSSQRRRQGRQGQAQPTGRPGRRPAVDTALPVLGVEATRQGWLGAVLEPSGNGTPHLVTAGTVEELMTAAGPVSVVAVGVPMGLPDDSRRQADRELRQLLGAQSSSVLTTPVREAVYAASHGEANSRSREHVGAGVSTQAWELRRRVQELDAWVRQDLPAVVVETHAEAAFTVMAGEPLSSRRRSGDGAQERRATLAAQGVYVPTTTPHGVATDDVLDVCAAAWSAHRVKTGGAQSFPEQAEVFSDGIPSAVQV